MKIKIKSQDEVDKLLSVITAYPKKKNWYQVEWIAEQGGTYGEYDPDLDNFRWISITIKVWHTGGKNHE